MWRKTFFDANIYSSKPLPEIFFGIDSPETIEQRIENDKFDKYCKSKIIKLTPYNNYHYIISIDNGLFINHLVSLKNYDQKINFIKIFYTNNNLFRCNAGFINSSCNKKLCEYFKVLEKGLELYVCDKNYAKTLINDWNKKTI